MIQCGFPTRIHRRFTLHYANRLRVSIQKLMSLHRSVRTANSEQESERIGSEHPCDPIPGAVQKKKRVLRQFLVRMQCEFIPTNCGAEFAWHRHRMGCAQRCGCESHATSDIRYSVISSCVLYTFAGRPSVHHSAHQRGGSIFAAEVTTLVQLPLPHCDGFSGGGAQKCNSTTYIYRPPGNGVSPSSGS